VTHVLFPSSPIEPKSVDDSFAGQAEAAKEAGFGIGRVDLEGVVGGRIANVPEDAQVVYRGWFMPPAQYRTIHERLGGRLISSPDGYETAYELPRWYVLVKDVTPRTLILPLATWGSFENLGDIAECVEHTFRTRFSDAQEERIAEITKFDEEQRAKGAPFFHRHWPTDLLELPGPRPVMVKDYVKSAKHKWFDACFIRDSRDREETARVIRNFLDEQGTGLVGGLCFRQFEHYKRIGVHPKTQLPLVNEWRAFMHKGMVFYHAPYWRDGDYSLGAQPSASEIESLAAPLKDLDLIAVDVAEKEHVSEGGPRFDIIEINPGGASDVPEGGDVKEFYKALRREYPE
jgi:hypothetical protein